MNSPLNKTQKRPLGTATKIVMLAGAFLVLSGCGKASDPATTATSTPPSAAAPAPAPAPVAQKEGADEQAKSQKINAYTQGYNKLIGTFGLSETEESYLKDDIPKRKASENISITAGWVSIANDLLKKGRAMNAGGLEQIDKGADKLIASLDALVAQLDTLNVYYESKAYKEDKLEKGKAADPAVRAAFAQSNADMAAFNDLLSIEEKKHSASVLAQLKASGNMLGYGTKLALQQASEIVALFNNEADIRNPAKYQAADALVAQLEKTLTDQRAAYAAAKAKQPPPDYDYESTASSLVTFIGNYRTVKESKSAKDFDDVIKEYNRAVENANGIN